MSKFKTGDKVRTKPGLDPQNLRGDGPGLVRDMDRHVGTEMTVTRITNTGNIEAKGWVWHPDWLEHAVPVDDSLKHIREAVIKAAATATEGNLLAAASNLGIKVEQRIHYVVVP